MSWGGPPQGAYGTGQGYRQPYQQQQQQQPYQQPYGGGQQYGANPPYQGQQPGMRYGAPPPQGYGPPPTQQYGNPQMQGYGAPPPQAGGYGHGGYGQPGPPPGVDPEVWNWFVTVDEDRSQKITATELQKALMNNNWSHFNAETCRLMIGMFDKDKSGTIDIFEFQALWKYVQDWKRVFESFDTDRSGNIDAGELHNAFNTFGYRLSPNFSQLVVCKFDRQARRSIKFDDFIQACVMLKGLTDRFKVKDTQQTGMVRMSYEEFLEMVLDNTIS